MNEELAKVIFAAGVRCGYSVGIDDATAYEHGAKSRCVVDPEEVWKDNVQWLLEVKYGERFDMTKPEHWEMVP